MPWAQWGVGVGTWCLLKDTALGSNVPRVSCTLGGGGMGQLEGEAVQGEPEAGQGLTPPPWVLLPPHPCPNPHRCPYSHPHNPPNYPLGPHSLPNDPTSPLGPHSPSHRPKPPSDPHTPFGPL